MNEKLWSFDENVLKCKFCGILCDKTVPWKSDDGVDSPSYNTMRLLDNGLCYDCYWYSLKYLDNASWMTFDGKTINKEKWKKWRKNKFIGSDNVYKDVDYYE